MTAGSTHHLGTPSSSSHCHAGPTLPYHARLQLPICQLYLSVMPCNFAIFYSIFVASKWPFIAVSLHFHCIYCFCNAFDFTSLHYKNTSHFTMHTGCIDSYLYQQAFLLLSCNASCTVLPSIFTIFPLFFTTFPRASTGRLSPCSTAARKGFP